MNKYYAERKQGLANYERLPETTANLSFKVWAVPNNDKQYIGKVYSTEGDEQTLYSCIGISLEEATQYCVNFIKRCFEIKENKSPESSRKTLKGYYTIEVDEEPYTDKKYYGTVCYVKPTQSNLVYRTVLYNCCTGDYDQTRLQCEHALQYFKDNGIINTEIKG